MMKPLVFFNILLFSLSFFGILLVFALYPLAVWVMSLSRNKRNAKQSNSKPSVSLLVVVRNAEDFIEDKVLNSLSLDYPKERLEIIFFSDGSTDATEKIIRSYEGQGVRIFSSHLHRGKREGINSAMKSCSGDIVVFSDADALLSPDALYNLVRHYGDPEVGGVCGQRVIYEDRAGMKEAQSRYIKFDSTIKMLESSVGSITSNDGKLYSIRRELFQPIETSVTDDLYVSLSVIKQGYRFIFEPEARAYIRVPSRSPSHEIQRRRRIVSCSLRGVYLMRELLNPFQYGFFSIGLAINKVLRRFLPVCLILLFFSSLVLSFYNPLIKALLILQMGFYALALSYPALVRHVSGKRLGEVASLAFYFCLGNYGTLLGLVDFFSGRRITKWDPVKTD